MDYYVGIDMASRSFTSSIGEGENGWSVVGKAESFDNSEEGYTRYMNWLSEKGVTADNSLLCMENTGVYSEGLAYWLESQGYKVCVETPLKVKRSFDIEGHKSDAVDSVQIAEYAYRFRDELRIWRPRDEVLEQVKVLLATREQMVKERSGHMSYLSALRRKPRRVREAEESVACLIEALSIQIKGLEKTIKQAISEEAELAEQARLLDSVPGVGELLSAHALVVFHQMGEELSDKKVAAFLGICPLEHSSGSSIWRKPKSSGHGPEVFRKLLHLGSRSACTHNDYYRSYYSRKLMEGKAKSLVINNVGNKLLSVMVAVFKSGIPYIPGYRSFHPKLLTKS